jgi:hypothetical protein
MPLCVGVSNVCRCSYTDPRQRPLPAPRFGTRSRDHRRVSRDFFPCRSIPASYKHSMHCTKAVLNSGAQPYVPLQLYFHLPGGFRAGAFEQFRLLQQRMSIRQLRPPSLHAQPACGLSAASCQSCNRLPCRRASASDRRHTYEFQ